MPSRAIPGFRKSKKDPHEGHEAKRRGTKKRFFFVPLRVQFFVSFVVILLRVCNQQIADGLLELLEIEGLAQVGQVRVIQELPGIRI